VIAFSRPFWPLFLHIFGAMTTWGAILTATILAFVAWNRPDAAFLRKATLRALLVAVPAYIVLRVFAQIILSDEDYAKDPGWVGFGFLATDVGLLLFLIAIGCAVWWTRSGKAVAGRIVACVSAVYLLLLTVAMLAMSGKWG
jgi:cytochrome bd-type quinol oxidase subunit 1